MVTLYYRDAKGRIWEFEASTNAGVYAWFRRWSDGESVRLKVADLTPMTQDEVMAVVAPWEPA